MPHPLLSPNELLLNVERLLLCLLLLYVLYLLYQQHRVRLRRLWQRSKDRLPHPGNPNHAAIVLVVKQESPRIAGVLSVAANFLSKWVELIDVEDVSTMFIRGHKVTIMVPARPKCQVFLNG